MDYAAAAESAPAGWTHFARRDFDRLPAAVRKHELRRVPAAEARLLAESDRAADERFRRAEFWTLVYQLEPERWDRLAQAEPITGDLIGELPRVRRALEVGAGSGRLTHHLAQIAERVIAIEPSLGLLRLLRARLPRVHSVAGWAEALPVRDGWSELTAACGALGPDPQILRELERVTCRNGIVALINPEQPEWFESNGWERIEAEPAAVLAHDPSIDEFFGPPDPPRVLLMRTI